GDAAPPGALTWAWGRVDVARPAAEVQADLDWLGVAEHRTPVVEPPVYPADHPHARAAALTPERARELVENPTLETSWFVLAKAAKVCKVPLWKLEPESPWKPPAEPKQPDPPIALPAVTPVRPRQLGPGGPVVA